ncbi:MAG: transposase [Candidatus Omnitrophica bacterium]|nr:transposase [Candidatus Omnitrophota bacterium]
MISRGNANQNLFRDDDDYRQYLSFLRQAVDLYPMHVYNYVLLPNFLHLLVETKKEGALSKAMEMVTREYAKYFNAKYNSTGHVFQGRFKSFTVQDDLYFLSCSKYIDLLPVREGVVSSARDYRWSGHSILAYGEKKEFDLDKHELYRSLGGVDIERQLVYKNLIVQQQLGPDIDFEGRKAGILGTREFKNLIKDGKTNPKEVMAIKHGL